jgi:hypothetical protein
LVEELYRCLFNLTFVRLTFIVATASITAAVSTGLSVLFRCSVVFLPPAPVEYVTLQVSCEIGL